MGNLTKTAVIALAFSALAAQARDLGPDDFTRRHNEDKAQAMLVHRILDCPAGGNGWAKFERGQAFVLCGDLGTMKSARIDCATGAVTPLLDRKSQAATPDSRKAVRELCRLA